MLGAVLGREAELVSAAARPGDIRASLGDPAMARGLLGCAAGTRLEDGLAATLGDRG
jgi:hypothetical protein